MAGQETAQRIAVNTPAAHAAHFESDRVAAGAGEQIGCALPAVCLPPTDAHVTGRFTAVSQWLLRNSTGILYCGLGLFVGLIGYALIRSPLGLAWDNLPACIAFLAMLSALCFVWSKAPVERETIERDLDYKLAAYFKSVDNLKRAAIFEHKAGLLKNQ